MGSQSIKTAGRKAVNPVATRRSSTAESAKLARALGADHNHFSKRLPAAQNTSNSPDHVRVLLIGSSVADGWGDNKGGYLQRAFRALATKQHVDYQLINECHPGLAEAKLANKIPRWIQKAHAAIVVFAWGGLDDAIAHLPLSKLKGDMAQQIQESINGGARVMVITPPISPASYGKFKTAQPVYLNAETQVARAAASKGEPVNTFDVFNQMKASLARRHLKYQPFSANEFHANPKGHALAAKLLLADIKGAFGDRPLAAPGDPTP